MCDLARPSVFSKLWGKMAETSFVQQQQLLINVAEFLENPTPLSARLLYDLLAEPRFLKPVFRKVILMLGEDFVVHLLRESFLKFRASTEKRLDNGEVRSLCGIFLKRLKLSPHSKFIF